MSTHNRHTSVLAKAGLRVQGFRVPGSGFNEELISINPYMKFNGTVLDRRAIFRDTISNVGDFRNLKSQAPNVKKSSNDNIQ
jgi:hypothetical protein